MENNNENYMLTREGYEKIEKELEELKVVKRREVSEKLKVARSFGDLSENAEYDEAKNEQAQLEERIGKLENIIRKAQIIDEGEIDKSRITVGTTCNVKIKYPDGEIEENKYTIVGSTEADPVKGKISNKSPIGNALMGQKAKSIVDAEVPDGVARIEILSIE